MLRVCCNLLSRLHLIYVITKAQGSKSNKLYIYS